MPLPSTVAIVHYHLRGGGVTRVIQHAVRALAQRGVRCVVIVGERPDDALALEAEIAIVPALAYDATGDADALADDLEAVCDGRAEVFHIHNHALGKNRVLPPAVRRLAERGRRLVLQPHDFAEDGRPANYRALVDDLGRGGAAALSRALYPVADHVRYVTLNQRDATLLASAGMTQRLSVLPNAVDLSLAEAPDPLVRDGRLFLYPTRAIRRKNLGEMLLWAALGGAGDRFAATLAPQNPKERPRYERWKRFAAEYKLPVAFEVGDRCDTSFAALLGTADAMITTSIAEGFGLAFLEPALAGRPIVGRDLPQITADFKAAGVALPNLYAHAPIALPGLRDRLAEALRPALTEAFAAYGRQATPHDIDAALGAAETGGGIDFARLDEPLQEQVIAAAVAGDLPSPPALCDDLSGASVESNAAAIRTAFSLERYGERLAALYDEAMRSEPGPVDALDASRVLDAFLDPARFYLLRS